VETDVKQTTRETKEQMGKDINDMMKLKIKNWTNCIQDSNNWKYMLRRPKHSKIEFEAPKEEEEL
jgi:hypothetical protein